jgi:pyrroloquinoline quinone biosynthesis protein B
VAASALALGASGIACARGGAPASPDRALAAGEARFELVVLGVAQDGGLPHFGCAKACCATARREGRTLRPASLGIHDRRERRIVLVEATPAVEEQVALLHERAGVEPRERRPVDAVLLTHAHVGHYTGLVHFGREVAATSAVPVHVTERMSAYLRSNGPWSQLVELDQIRLVTVVPGVPFRPIPGIEVTAIAVPHRQEYADTVAYRISGPRRTVTFAPDVDRWEDGLLDRLLEGADVAYLDATWYDGSELPGRDLREIPHPPMVETMERLAERARERPGSIRFVHLNHTNPALHDAKLRREIRERGFLVATEGERIGL